MHSECLNSFSSESYIKSLEKWLCKKSTAAQTVPSLLELKSHKVFPAQLSLKQFIFTLTLTPFFTLSHSHARGAWAYLQGTNSAHTYAPSKRDRWFSTDIQGWDEEPLQGWRVSWLLAAPWVWEELTNRIQSRRIIVTTLLPGASLGHSSEVH